jgi:hypothetical protein
MIAGTERIAPRQRDSGQELLGTKYRKVISYRLYVIGYTWQSHSITVDVNTDKEFFAEIRITINV